MFENIKNIFRKSKKRELLKSSSKDTAKERLHLVLMQDRANVSADFLELMRGEIIEVIKKYIDIDEDAMDVRLTTEANEDGVQGAPALYANIPIINIKDETRKLSKTNQEKKLNETNSDGEKESEKIDITNDALIEDKEKDKKIEDTSEENDKKENPKEDIKETGKTEEKNDEKTDKITIEKEETISIEKNKTEKKKKKKEEDKKDEE